MARSPTPKLTTSDGTSRLQTLRAGKPRTYAGDTLIAQSFAASSTISDRSSEFLDLIEPSKQPSDLVLASSVSRTLYDVLDEYRNADAIRRHNLPLRNRLLFCGPPGCGKSITAEVLARETGLPFMVAKLDVLVGSLLGETASNLRKIFDTVERQGAVLFLDEFDALARTRSDPGEHSEMRRVVNNLLLMIERFKGRGFIVAATNLESTIDPAITRRFDEVVFFGNPAASDIRRLIKLKTKNFPADVDVAEHARLLVGRSYADVERICFTAMRRAILAKRKRVTEEDFGYAIESDQRRREVRHRVVAQ